MAKNNPIGSLGLSYYRLSLLSYLKDAHPDKSKDLSSIKKRADEAAEIYSKTIQSGGTHPEAEDAANEELYRGLHFSPYNTLVNILWNEFAAIIPEEETKQTALRVLPLCGNVLAKYTLTDDFAETPSFDLLYTELTGTIQILLDDGKL